MSPLERRRKHFEPACFAVRFMQSTFQNALSRKQVFKLHYPVAFWRIW
jgi:hypothetical protein